jgi:hypothetical protein
LRSGSNINSGGTRERQISQVDEKERISSHSHLLQQFSVGAVKFVLLIERSFEGRFHTGATKTSDQTHGDSSITLSTYILSASSVAFELISSFSLVSELRSASNEALLM